MLRRIAEKPAHGYDILQEIASKTEGSWRPGPGSIYPILKELLAEGLVKADARKVGATSQRVYHITPSGSRFLKQSSDTILKAGKNWGAMRRIFIELVEPQELPNLVTHMVSGQLTFIRELVDAKGGQIPSSELTFMLKEYVLNLQHQLDWANRMLKRL